MTSSGKDLNKLMVRMKNFSLRLKLVLLFVFLIVVFLVIYFYPEKSKEVILDSSTLSAKEFNIIFGEYSQLEETKNWQEIANLESKYRRNKKYSNAVQFLEGMKKIYEKNNSEDPAINIFTISPESGFYLPGMRKLANYYRNKYGTSPQELDKKLESIENEYNKNNLHDSYYFIIRWMRSKNYDELIANYKNFESEYKHLFDFNDYRPMASGARKRPIQSDIIQTNYIIPAVTYFYLYGLEKLACAQNSENCTYWKEQLDMLFSSVDSSTVKTGCGYIGMHSSELANVQPKF